MMQYHHHHACIHVTRWTVQRKRRGEKHSFITNQTIPYISISTYYTSFLYNHSFLHKHAPFIQILKFICPQIHLFSPFFPQLFSEQMSEKHILAFHSFAPHGQTISKLTFILYLLLHFFLFYTVFIFHHSSYISQVSHLYYTEMLPMPFTPYLDVTSIYQCWDQHPHTHTRTHKYTAIPAFFDRFSFIAYLLSASSTFQLAFVLTISPSMLPCLKHTS